MSKFRFKSGDKVRLLTYDQINRIFCNNRCSKNTGYMRIPIPELMKQILNTNRIVTITDNCFSGYGPLYKIHHDDYNRQFSYNEEMFISLNTNLNKRIEIINY